MDYLKSLPAQSPHDPKRCFLCEAAAAEDEATLEAMLVLHRDEHGLLMLNRYPYSNGHLLAAPLRHVPGLLEMTPEERSGLMELAALGQRLLERVCNPQGVNVGMNLGQAAGAGVPGHAHMHIVPRWNGDVNFMQVVGQVRVIPEALQASYAALREALVQELG